jgi:hypothetical protein
LWDLASGDELAQLISLGGPGWLVVTPNGLFDGSAEGRQKVSFRIPNRRGLVPVDRFFQDFFTPGLLPVLWRGERRMPGGEVSATSAPTVRILSPRQGGAVTDRTVTLEVEVRDEGGGIQGPWLFHNGARVLVNQDKEKRDRAVRCRFSVELVEGDNRLEIHAAAAEGAREESEPATLALRYEKPLDRPTLHLVAVGVSKYAQGSLQLKFARADAEALAGLFDGRGKALYQEVKLHPLLDEAATRQKITTTLSKVAQQARTQDTLLLFVAGHGTLVGQRYYFIPHDFRTQSGKSRDEDVREQGIPADILSDFLSSGPALKRMLILDTCASGGAVDLFRVASRNPFALRGEIERLSRSQGVFVLAASAATEEAKEPEPLGHGALSYALLAGLKAVNKGPLEGRSAQPSGPQQLVDVLEWFGFAAGQVPRLTREYCGQEQNVHHAGKGSSFPVLPLAIP